MQTTKAKAKPAGAKKPEVVTAFKAFDADLKCRDFQYEVGKSYTISGDIKVCNNGFHACTEPFDVWKYYPIFSTDGRLTRYAEVEQSGAIDRCKDDSKIASAEITIKAELTLPDFIRRAVDRRAHV